MEKVSLSLATRRLETEVRRNIRQAGPEAIGIKEREILADLTQCLTDSRIYAQAYELSETRDEQLDNAKQAKYWLNKVHKDILAASQKDIFSAVDVAHLSAQIEQISSRLK